MEIDMEDEKIVEFNSMSWMVRTYLMLGVGNWKRGK